MVAKKKTAKKRTSGGYTHVCAVLDRSTSMLTIRDATIAGFNTYLADQQAKRGKMTMTLNLFSGYAMFKNRFSVQPVKDVKRLTRRTYELDGRTALFDAIGKTIIDTEKAILDMSAAKRPKTVVMLVLTDGQENDSKEFKTREEIAELIARKSKQRNVKWVFTFVGVEGVEDFASGVGIPVINTLRMTKSVIGTQSTFKAMSEGTSKIRSSGSKAVVAGYYTDDDRKTQDDLLKDTDSRKKSSSKLSAAVRR